MHFADSQKINKSVIKEPIPAKLQTKSNHDPPVQNALLESFQKLVSKEVLEKWDTVKKPKNNLSYKQRMAIKELKSDPSRVMEKSGQRGGGHCNYEQTTVYKRGQ